MSVDMGTRWSRAFVTLRQNNLVMSPRLIAMCRSIGIVKLLIIRALVLMTDCSLPVTHDALPKRKAQTIGGAVHVQEAEKSLLVVYTRPKSSRVAAAGAVPQNNQKKKENKDRRTPSIVQ